MKFIIPPDHPLRQHRAPQGSFWETTHPSELRDLHLAFTEKPFREVMMHSKSLGKKVARFVPNEKAIVAKAWTKDVFFVFAAILNIPQSVGIQAFKTVHNPKIKGETVLDPTGLKEAWSKAIMVTKKNFDPVKALQSFYAGRRSSGSSEPLSVELERAYHLNHALAIRASEKRVDDATNPES